MATFELAGSPTVFSSNIRKSKHGTFKTHLLQNRGQTEKVFIVLRWAVTQHSMKGNMKMYRTFQPKRIYV
jgi:hypothetical protein